ncbi:MAG: hypothetical protein NTY02_00360 [Acidobacteria bacterium]|nr:hypothetical protein [Acidobacteriota bacterium]
MTTPTLPARVSLPRIIAVLLLLVFFAVLVRTAWISDDAQISLRTVMNVTHGNGLTFNVGERVQTFTHPLWLLCLTACYLVLGNVYYATFALSFAVSILVFWRAMSRAASAWQSWLAAAVLLSSRAFVDYSTSGLENPLACLILIGFVSVLLDERLNRRLWLTGLWGLGALAYLTRPDTVLLVVPALALASWRVRRAGLVAGAVAIGLLPAVAWTTFAPLYYGFPFPNTAYAKLGVGISQGQLWKQGVLYLVDSLDRDPATLVTILAAAAWSLATRMAFARAMAVGIVCYLLYVASIGGDFMSGRFLAVPVFAAMLILTRMLSAAREAWVVSIIAVVALSAASARMPLFTDSRFGDTGVKHSGVSDERVFYFRKNSLVFASMNSFDNPDWDAPRPAGQQRVMNTCGLMGEGGLDWGPHYYMLDECALADPLLARLPAVFKEEWRPGHFRRWVPDGYRESLVSGVNTIRNPKLREFYDRLSLITRGRELWSADRLSTIWRMNTGGYNHLIDPDYYRFSGFIKYLDELSDTKADETPSDAPGTIAMKLPLAVRVDDRPGRRYMDVSVDADDVYAFVFVKQGAAVGRLTVGPVPAHRRKPGLVSYTIDLPSRPTRVGFDTIMVLPGGGDESYSLGHLLLEGNPKTDRELLKRVAVRDGVITP